MRWIDIAPTPELDPDTLMALARRAVEQSPASAPHHCMLARNLHLADKYAEAATHFEAALENDPASFTDWDRLSHCYAETGRLADALGAAERGAERGPDKASIHYRRGLALRALERAGEARSAFERCVALGDYNRLGLMALLQPFAQQRNGAALLAQCEALAPEQADNALVRANRAIALSLVGRTDEARALVDLDRHVVQDPIPTPTGFRDIAALNAAIADEALQRQNSQAQARSKDIRYCPDLRGRPALSALLGVIRAAIEGYCRTGARIGLDRALPPPPAVAQLFYGTTVLREDGRNGEHIHHHGRVSAVYHVQVPDSVANAEDDRGMLTIGDCSSYANGYSACWGTRLIRPRAGMLTLFPSHFFHDVVPSRSSEPRISIAADLVVVQA